MSIKYAMLFGTLALTFLAGVRPVEAMSQENQAVVVQIWQDELDNRGLGNQCDGITNAPDIVYSYARDVWGAISVFKEFAAVEKTYGVELTNMDVLQSLEDKKDSQQYELAELRINVSRVNSAKTVREAGITLLGTQKMNKHCLEALRAAGARVEKAALDAAKPADRLLFEKYSDGWLK